MRPAATSISCAASSKQVIEAGATTINLPDTVGFSTPDEMRDFFSAYPQRVPNADKAVFSAHCHDDLGLAVANSLAAVQGGARQVECTVNGIGERAGNAALEEIVMALHVRRDRMPYTVDVVQKEMYPSSEMLTRLTGQGVQVNKAIVGRNAFAHEAGIHQDGMLKDRRTYEIMRAEDVGAPWNPLVLGRHSGRHAVQKRCTDLGLALDVTELGDVYRALDGDGRRSQDPGRSGCRAGRRRRSHRAACERELDRSRFGVRPAALASVGHAQRVAHDENADCSSALVVTGYRDAESRRALDSVRTTSCGPAARSCAASASGCRVR